MVARRAWLLGTLLGLLTAVAGCGLEPRYMVLPPPAESGMAVWAPVGEVPGAGYTPVMLGDPPVSVCRVFVRTPPGKENDAVGFIIGETAGDTCRLAWGGAVLARAEPFELLYLRAGVTYSWASRDELRPDQTHERSRLWANNAVPIEPIPYPNGGYSHAWLPCAAPVEGRWRIGQLPLNYGAERARCFIAGESGEIRVRPGYRALYVPLDQ